NHQVNFLGGLQLLSIDCDLAGGENRVFRVAHYASIYANTTSGDQLHGVRTRAIAELRKCPRQSKSVRFFFFRNTHCQNGYEIVPALPLCAIAPLAVQSSQDRRNHEFSSAEPAKFHFPLHPS